jgi:filamentous hemagglutinin family protein
MKTREFNQFYWQLGLAGFLAIGGAMAPICARAVAQIIPDSTLGAESSVVTPNVDINGSPNDQIDGGAIRGVNLFHSFEVFNIGEERGAYFSNPAGIENILSRVTGSSPSNIFGKLGVLGNANLFLINPNGIIFGANASLDLGGSFVASTASSLNFADGTQFSATAPQATPVLTVNVPVGLQFGSKVGSIQVQGNGQGFRTTTELIDTPFGLRVQPDQTLALVGGDVILEGGTLKTAGGRIELGSVASPSLVKLIPIDKGYALEYSDVSTFGDLRLSQQAAVDASGAGGGDIQIRGKRVTLTDLSSIEASTLGAEPGGILSINTSELVELRSSSIDGLASGIFSLVYPKATGTGGDITIETGQLILRDGTLITTVTSGEGAAGNLSVKASESVELIGGDFPSVLITSVYFGANGAGGNISVDTPRLTIRDGARITAATYGRGQGGNVKIKTGQLIVQSGGGIGSGTFNEGKSGSLLVSASELVELIGTTADSQYGSGLFTSVQPEATGDGGNLTLETKQLTIRDGAGISAGTLGKGSGGNLNISASELVELIGTRTAADGRVFSSGLFTSTEGVGEEAGSAGNLRIETKQLTIRDRATASVRSTSLGKAGELQVTVRNILLDNQGKLNAETASGNGGNITLHVQDLLSMRRNSQISSTAGTAQVGGDGGNINIDAGLIAALENSDITANAFEGRGGNVQISTQGLFLSPDSQITATSDRGIDGVVEIRTPDVELQNSLTQLAANFASPDSVVAGSCLARRNVERGSFTITGTGGLPASPYEAIGSRYEVSNIQSIGANGRVSKPAAIVATTPWKRGEPIREAQGMTVTTDGHTIVGTTSQIATIAKPQNLICPSD